MSAATSGEGRTITLGGGLPTQRTFRILTSRTLAQDIWMVRAVRLAGLDAITVPKGAASDSELFNVFLTTLVEKVFAADVVGDLLAGALMPVGEKAWTAPVGEATKVFLLAITNEEEKKQLLAMLSEIIYHFLSSGRNS